MPSVGTNRILINGSCSCLEKYYEGADGGYQCLGCHYSCLSCNGAGVGNCLSCSINVGRVLNGGTCTCRAGYNDNGQS